MALVRVVIPVYNRENSIGAALDSVCAQTASDLEVLVADDGSSDATCECVRRCAADDPRIHLLTLTHGGVAPARNSAIAEPGSHEYVAFLDSDDLWHPEHLQRALDALAKVPAASVYFGRVEVEDLANMWTKERLAQHHVRIGSPVGIADAAVAGDIYELKPETLRKAMLFSQFSPQPSSVLVRRSAVGRAQWFREDLKVLEDCQFFLYLANNNCGYVFDDQIHVKMRRYGDNLSGITDVFSERAAWRLESVLAYRKEKLGYCQTEEERAFVRNEIYETLYLLGQNYAQRLELPRSRKVYAECLRLRRSYPALKGFFLSMLPANIYRTLRQVRDAESDGA